jgi:hypothetical protein
MSIFFTLKNISRLFNSTLLEYKIASPLGPLSEYVEGKEGKGTKKMSTYQIDFSLAPLYVLGEGLGVRRFFPF